MAKTGISSPLRVAFWGSQRRRRAASDSSPTSQSVRYRSSRTVYTGPRIITVPTDDSKTQRAEWQELNHKLNLTGNMELNINRPFLNEAGSQMSKEKHSRFTIRLFACPVWNKRPLITRGGGSVLSGKSARILLNPEGKENCLHWDHQKNSSTVQ